MADTQGDRLPPSPRRMSLALETAQQLHLDPRTVALRDLEQERFRVPARHEPLAHAFDLLTSFALDGR